MEDMILVSVDDHVFEPPDMFQQHVPAQWKDRAPRLVRKADGSDVWVFEGKQIPNIGLNAVAGRPPEEYGMEPTALSQLRPGCCDVDERISDMNANGVLGSLCFPSLPGFVGELFGGGEGRQARARHHHAARVQRLAHRRVVRDASRALHAAGDPADLGRGGDGGAKCGAWRARAVTPSRSPKRRAASAIRACTASTGIRSGRPAATRTSSCACTSARAPG